MTKKKSKPLKVENIDPNEARTVLAIDQQERIQRTLDAIQVALKKNKTELDISITLRAGQIIPRLDIIPIVEQT